MKKKWRIAAVLFACILIAGIGCGIYISDYYPAKDAALEAIRHPAGTVTVSTEHTGQIAFVPEDPVTGLIFYPGAKIQYESYAPLMEQCAENGLLCVLVHMPANLAILNKNAANGIQELYPQVSHWYIGGHSLGGAMAASYAADHTAEYEGVILLAAYSTGDLSASSLKILSIYGSEDEVLNKASYEKYRTNLPADFTEVILEGGCHAYFGCYGAQDGDGTPTITNEEQMIRTTEAIVDFLSR